jgi:hypothetical protein
MEKNNTMPLSEEEALKMPSNFSQEYYHGFFAPRRMPGTKQSAAICLPVGQAPERLSLSCGIQQESTLSECYGRRNDDLTMDALTLQKVLDERIANLKKQTAVTKLVAPDPIMQLTHYILGMMPNKFKNDSNEIPDTE